VVGERKNASVFGSLPEIMVLRGSEYVVSEQSEVDGGEGTFAAAVHFHRKIWLVFEKKNRGLARPVPGEGLDIQGRYFLYNIYILDRFISV